MRSAFGLPGPPQEQFLSGAGRKRPGRFSKAMGLFRQPLFKGFLVLDATPLLHAHAPSLEKSESAGLRSRHRSQPEGPRGDATILRPAAPARHAFISFASGNVLALAQVTAFEAVE
jgi:hypothetical protein